MMLSPVSNVNVGRVRFAGEGVAANPLERAGAYAKAAAEAAPADDIRPEKKKGHGLRNTIIGLVVAAGALVALKKANVLKVLGETELGKAKFYSPAKIGHYLAKAGEFIGKYTYDPVAKLFKGKAAS